MYTPAEYIKIKNDKKNVPKAKKKIYWYYLPEKRIYINTNKSKEKIMKIRNVTEVINSSEADSLRTKKIVL